VDELVREARALEAQGVRELNIISQDTTWYGRDRSRTGVDEALLPDLLKALLAGTEIPWFRLFYMYPSGITLELVELLASEPRFLPYLDMPVQHGSDRILKAMRRPERQSTIRERVRWLREAIPELTLRTTVIVGFPGETEGDFQELLALLEELRFDRVGAFTYSVEEGTPAAVMVGQLPDEVKAERMEALMDVQREISFELNLAQVGTRTIALVDRVLEDDPDFGFQARIKSQALDVDGVTNLFPADGVTPGTFVEIEIVDALDYDLIGAVRR
jgi:ribosomal protein S12 methylthiotransferase